MPENSEISQRPASTFPFRNAPTCMQSERHPTSGTAHSTAVCQEWAPGPRQRGQQEAEPSELAKVQRGNFLRKTWGCHYERGSELLVGQVVTLLADETGLGTRKSLQVFYLSTALSGLSPVLLFHLTLCPVFLYLSVFCVFSFSPSPQ